MEYQKPIDLLDNTINQPSEFKTRNLLEINDESWRTYNVKLNLKLQWLDQIYMIIVMHAYMLKEL